MSSAKKRNDRLIDDACAGAIVSPNWSRHFAMWRDASLSIVVSILVLVSLLLPVRLFNHFVGFASNTNIAI